MNRRNEVVVGAVILAGIALIVFGTIWLSETRLGVEERVVTARFREVGQLLEGNNAKFRGVPIGRVEEVALEADGGAVLVSFTIDPDVVLPADAVVILSPESMFGDWQAEIISRSQFPRYTYTEAPEPGILPGYTLPDISRLTAVADRIAENIAVLTDRIGIAFTEETARNIREAIENFQQVSAELTGLVEAQGRTVEEIGAELQVATQALAAAAENARAAFAEVEAAIDEGELQGIVGNARLASARLDTLAVTLLATSQQLQSAVVSADSFFGPAEDVMSRIARGEGTLGRLVQDTSLFNELVQTNQTLQMLLADIQQNPKKYINLRVF